MSAPETETERLTRENDFLRALIPALGVPCVYCGLTEIAKCARGFPGCAAADDLIVGEDEAWHRIVKERDELKATVRQLQRVMMGE